MLASSRSVEKPVDLEATARLKAILESLLAWLSADLDKARKCK